MATPATGHTPMIEHYLSVKREHPDKIVLYRMGDFYETFFEDAIEMASLLNITLTKRNHGSGNEIPLAGVPHHALQGYLDKLIALGKSVAICEQVENPKHAQGLVKREVKQIVTPGTTLSDTLLDGDRNNFLLGLSVAGDVVGLCEADVTTGGFRVRETSLTGYLDDIKRLGPAEILAAESWLDENRSSISARLPGVAITSWPDWNFGEKFARERLLVHFKVTSLKGFGAEGLTAGLGAAGAVMSYLEDTQRTTLTHIQRLEVVDPSGDLVMDATTVRNLEIFQPLNGSDKGATLVSVLSRTSTPMGGRMLRQWLFRPLASRPKIEERLLAVETLVNQAEKKSLEPVLEPLSKIRDLERLMAKVCCGRAGPRDLVALAQSLAHLPELVEEVSKLDAVTAYSKIDNVPNLSDMVNLILEQISDDPPANFSDGGIFRDGLHEDLDELRELSRGGRDWITRMEISEREKTGISTLKVKYNNAFGYFIEVSKAQSEKVPEEYSRKQTLVNAERYITPDLKEYEAKVLGAEEQISELEMDLFLALRDQIAARAADVLSAATSVATVDVLSALAGVATENRYCRPTITDDDTIEIVGGRHPVVEKLMREDQFVSNDILLNGHDSQILVITGPNMAGKSTILRQTGLIVLLAHIGSYVPADRATIGISDRIFTRVGAQDNLAGGESTFLVEMQETANILHNCTDRSLVLFDEVGRGTSTFDGLSIAWSIVEFLHNTEGKEAKTLFATHYHEMNDLEEQCERVKNFNVSVTGSKDKMVFLHKLLPGGCDHSYGIEVARMAGLPEPVLDRAREVLTNLETHELSAHSVSGKKATTPVIKPPSPQMRLFTIVPDHPVLGQLREVDLSTITPMEALKLMDRWQNILKAEEE